MFRRTSVSVPNNKVGVNLINKPMGSKGLLNVIRFMILPTHLASQELWLKYVQTFFKTYSFLRSPGNRGMILAR